jgi:hypothetical protein
MSQTQRRWKAFWSMRFGRTEPSALVQLDPGDRAHLEAAIACEPAQADALRRHFAEQFASTWALRVRCGPRDGGIPHPRGAGD